MRYLIAFVLFSVLLLLPQHLEARYFARWHTTMGDFTAELRDDLAPITANNFINLANDHFYDGLRFHRVVANFVIQDGDPLGNGTGGPGYTIADEFNVGLYHNAPGMLAMANTGQPHSAGSQYYITLVPYPSLDGHYGIFGKVIQGMDVVQSIGLVPVNANDTPLTPVYINTLEILGLVVNSVSPADSIVTYDAQTPYPFVMEAYGLITNPNFQWYVNGVLQAQTDFLFEPVFTSPGEYEIRCITSDETISFTFTWHVTVTGVGNSDPVVPVTNLILSNNYPNPFRGMTSVSYQTKTNDPIRINVYDIRGRVVSHEGNILPKQGMNRWNWNGHSFASGIYLFEFKSGTESKVLKGILMK